MEVNPSGSAGPVVVVDDDENDIFFLKRLLTKAGVTRPVLPFLDAEEAIAYFEALAKDHAAPLPLLAIIDVRMPIRDGFEVLSGIRAHRHLDPTAVVMVSSSSASRDVKRAFTLGAQCYLVKYPFAQVFGELVAEAALYATDPDPAHRLSLTANLFGSPVLGAEDSLPGAR